MHESIAAENAETGIRYFDESWIGNRVTLRFPYRPDRRTPLRTPPSEKRKKDTPYRRLFVDFVPNST